MSGSTRTDRPASTGTPPSISSQAGRNRAGLAALFFAALSVVLTLVVESEWLWWLDNPVLEWIRASRTGAGISGMLLVSCLSSEYATPVVVTICALLMARRGRFWPRYFFVMAVSSTAWQIALKHFLARPRPQPPLVPYWTGAGYPSGHALTSLCIALGWLLWLRQHPTRLSVKPAQLAAVKAALILWPLLVGLSRVYIDAHWTSDILGGYVFGLMHFYASLFLAGRYLAGDSPSLPRKPLP